MNIAAIMIPKVLTVFLHETDTIRQGLERFTVHGYTAVPVLNEQEQYIGSVTEGDFLRHLLKIHTTELKTLEQYRVADIVRRDYCPQRNGPWPQNTADTFCLWLSVYS